MFDKSKFKIVLDQDLPRFPIETEEIVITENCSGNNKIEIRKSFEFRLYLSQRPQTIIARNIKLMYYDTEILDCSQFKEVVVSDADTLTIMCGILPSSQTIEKIVDIRNKFKLDKNYEASDDIRNFLNFCGIILEDCGDKTNWRISS